MNLATFTVGTSSLGIFFFGSDYFFPPENLIHHLKKFEIETRLVLISYTDLIIRINFFEVRAVRELENISCNI